MRIARLSGIAPLARFALTAATLFFSACLFQTERPAGPAPVKAEREGQAELRVKLGPVGALAKSTASAGASAGQAIELAALYVTLTAEEEAARRDTLPLSGNAANVVSRNYVGLAAGKAWTLEAQTLDTRGRIIHSGRAVFPVEAGRTAEVNLNLPAFYSMLSAGFYPIADSVTRCRVLVDGEMAADTVFAKQSRVGDTIRLDHDYLSVGLRRVTLEVFGEYGGETLLLYAGDTLIEVIAGRDAVYDIQLTWRGPERLRGSAAMSVQLGAVGRVSVEGRLLDAANQAPVFLSLPDEMMSEAAPGSVYTDTLHAADPDGDAMGYSLLAGPPGMVLSDSILHWTPTPENALIPIVVAARDSKGGADTLAWTITLYPSRLEGVIASHRVLTRAGGPYWVSGDVLVQEGVTLTMEPGVRLALGDSRSIQINGTLIARGTEADSIVFTSSRPGRAHWKSILFAVTSADAAFDSEGIYQGGSILEYCRIDQGGKGTGGAVQMDNSSPFIHRSRISHGLSRGILAMGAPRIKDCLIRRNEGGGIAYTSTDRGFGNPRAEIDGNLIDSNAISTFIHGHGAGILLQNGARVTGNQIAFNGFPDHGDAAAIHHVCCGGYAVISGNRVEGNRSAWLAAGIFKGDSVLSNVFTGNVSRHDYGSFFESSVIVGNRFMGDSIVPLPVSSESATLIHVNGSIFRNNTLVGNRIPGSRSSALSIGWGPLETYGNNFLNPGIAFEVANVNSSIDVSVDASGNWWGTAEESGVHARILDGFDDVSLGIITYSPFLPLPAAGAPAP